MTQLAIVYGTKAQLIKMMPVIWELERRDIPHRLIDTGQHQSISADLRREYGIRLPDRALGARYNNVNTLGRGIAWMLTNLFRFAFRGRRARDDLFDGRKGLVMVHGDTASTLLATVIAKRAGQKVMHIEAGLRSWNLLHPFPEEMVRIAVMRLSDYLIAPSAQAGKNLSAMSLHGKVWRVEGNTGVDVVAADLKKEAIRTVVATRPYCVFTIHRMETLYNRRRLAMVVDTVLEAQSKVQVLFIQHAPTANRLARSNMVKGLEEAGVSILSLVNHVEFVHMLKEADYIVTDGGSVQEEAAYLGTPCLLMRMATERDNGLGENVVLSEMQGERIQEFLNGYEKYRRPCIDFDTIHPGADIVDIVESICGQESRESAPRSGAS